MLSRRAATLIEVLVSLVLGTIVLGAATSSVLRQQRTHERIASVAGAERQLRNATSVMANQLSYIDTDAGDLVPSEARDTAIQFRATITVALACEQSVGAVTFLPSAPRAVAFGGFASQPRTGDSLWFLGDSIWMGARIDAVGSVAASCPAPFSANGIALRMTLAGATDTIPAASALRVTRQSRYSFYRSGDGSWQLGFREWNDASGSFSAPQPVAGPLLRQPGGRRSRFQFFDAAGAEFAPSTEIDRRAARIRVITHALASVRERGQDSIRSDSLDVALQHAATR